MTASLTTGVEFAERPAAGAAQRDAVNHRFGDSAPAGELFRHLGFTAEHVAEVVNETVRQRDERHR
jgi:transketolase